MANEVLEADYPNMNDDKTLLMIEKKVWLDHDQDHFIVDQLKPKHLYLTMCFQHSLQSTGTPPGMKRS